MQITRQTQQYFNLCVIHIAMNQLWWEETDTYALLWGIITDVWFFFYGGGVGGTVCMWGVYKLEAHGGSLTPYNWDCNTIWPKAGNDTGNNSKSLPPVCQYFSCSNHHITVNFKWNWKTAYLKRPTGCSQQDPQFGIKTDFFTSCEDSQL